MFRNEDKERMFKRTATASYQSVPLAQPRYPRHAVHSVPQITIAPTHHAKHRISGLFTKNHALEVKYFTLVPKTRLLRPPSPCAGALWGRK